MLNVILEKILGFWDYCMENKKQSIITVIALFFAFMIFGYFSIVIIAKIISFVLGLIISIVAFYFSNILITLPLTLAGVWWYRNR
jgi:uncharacterized membrane protein YjjP (DUF1212 family)